MKILVASLSFRTSEKDLRQALGRFGQVASVRIVKDMDTGKPRGFGFVEMDNQTKAETAIQGLNAKELMGRIIKVSEAHAHQRRDGQTTDMLFW